MKSSDQIINIARVTLQIEADSIRNLIPLLNPSFAEVVAMIYNSKGRLVLTGIGKSAIIAQKITATLNSTGTPAVFMHAADAIHGDLGMVQADDMVLCLSKSGNTPEIKVLVPLVKSMGNKLIGMVGNLSSCLATEADYLLNTSVEKEACPHNLAPTSSTTAQLALGDALAVCLLECRNFGEADFARYHPGGALGKQLYLRTGELADRNAKPAVQLNDSMQKVVVEISSGRVGAVAVLQDGKVAGIITDGDIRRTVQHHTDLSKIKTTDIMGTHPKTIQHDELAVQAMSLMKQNNISQLVVLNGEHFYGFVHIHDLIREGLL